MEERLYNVTVSICSIKGTNKVRIFEISNEYCGASRFSDVNKETGKESLEYSTNSGSPDISAHEGIQRYLVCSARDTLILMRAGLDKSGRLKLREAS